jgi:hypothetical protein
MTRARRWIAWLLLLSLAAGLVILDAREGESEPDIAEPLAAATRTDSESPAPRAAADHGRTILDIRPRTPAEEPPDSFAPHDWTPPPPPPEAAAAAAAPTAPPLPFTVLGKQHAGGIWHVFLAIDDRIFVVKTGDMIDNDYRVEAIELPVLTLTYLPLNTRQTLAIGGDE